MPVTDGFLVDLACPLCRARLLQGEDHLACPPCELADCPRRFEYVGGFPDLIVGGRFGDEEDPNRAAYEEESTAHSVANYWIPHLRRLTAGVPGRPRVLAVGCGAGGEVDLLTRAGFDCVGIDCGQRSKAWSQREAKHALLLANGMHLPFPDATFDAAFCGCVFPHVGVVGDSFEVTRHVETDRQAMAKEMARVVRPGGAIVVTSPNRHFPLDLFHGRESGSYRVRPNWPGDPFLLSVGDYAALFRAAGCRDIEALPISGYWGFIRSKNNLKGFVLGAPVRFLFGLADRVRFLRASPLAPWIAVLARR
jgi:SAM-dependent methyltransferase